jgi:hypothetical protein
MRAGGKKCYGSPANKGDFVINTGYTPVYHRAASGASPAQHEAGKPRTGEVRSKNAAIQTPLASEEEK